MTRALAPLVIWAVYFVVVYSLQGVGCVEDWRRPVLTVALLALTAAALAAIAWVGLVSLRALRAMPDPRAVAETDQRRRFQATLGAWLSGLSFVATIYSAIPIMMLNPCAA